MGGRVRIQKRLRTKTTPRQVKEIVMSIATKRKKLRNKHMLSNDANEYVHSEETRSAGLAKSEDFIFNGISSRNKDISVYLAQDDNSYVIDLTADNIYGPFDDLGDAILFSNKAFGTKNLKTRPVFIDAE